jgi:hypothetical protein
MIKTLTSIALVAGCAIALAVPMGQAQITDRHNLMDAPRVNTGDREARILRECGSITNAHLRAGCIDTIEIELSEQHPSARWHDRMTGSTTGMMNSTGPNPYAPNMNDAGSGR